jgi:hypothetical protein
MYTFAERETHIRIAWGCGNKVAKPEGGQGLYCGTEDGAKRPATTDAKRLPRNDQARSAPRTTGAKRLTNSKLIVLHLQTLKNF